MSSKMNIAGVPMPITYAAENIVLGTLICNPGYVTDARRLLNENSFFEDNNKRIWREIVLRDDSAENISEMEILARVNSEHFKKNVFPHCNGTRTVSEVFSDITTLSRLVSAREMYFAAYDILKLTSEGNADAAMERADKMMQQQEQHVLLSDSKSVKEAIADVKALFEKREAMRKEGKALRVPTSFRQLDWYTHGGWASGNLIILAARPSIGKTAVMLQMAREAALSGAPAQVFSLEMTNEELVQRMIQANTDMTQYDMAQGRIDWSKFDAATGKFADLPLYLSDDIFYFDEIVSRIIREARKSRCRVVFIDYLQLISFREKAESMNYQIAAATKRLKHVAKEEGLSIVALCQLNRDKAKENRAPALHDIRDSGSIEQDADIVLMLDRPITAEEDKSHHVEMYLPKNRQGEAGHVFTLAADKFFANFEEEKVDGKPIVTYGKTPDQDIEDDDNLPF